MFTWRSSNNQMWGNPSADLCHCIKAVVWLRGTLYSCKTGMSRQFTMRQYLSIKTTHPSQHVHGHVSHQCWVTLSHEGHGSLGSSHELLFHRMAIWGVVGRGEGVDKMNSQGCKWWERRAGYLIDSNTGHRKENGGVYVWRGCRGRKGGLSAPFFSEKTLKQAVIYLLD